jgi:hypothetical protein
VRAQRMAGEQPVIITVRRDRLTKTIDNSFEAHDARDDSIGWHVRSAFSTEDLMWVEVLAVEHKGHPA